ncbi:MAG: ABC transporter permease [Phycisphaeraceae bacterium]|nr:ABC transporter permease [Phycisphaeraceae bacterium]MDG1360226.1 ABC transporter permease [Phycisphaerales bacterium]MCP4011529.1 ABC transporter permease [Phycisphaeraceae bacterium]MCP4067333.1 ABC transporter permease [Phycisphaeraceae bacterium]MCP4496936.1 ABC transporter permease [Phycisphaeraceae bacterium]
MTGLVVRRLVQMPFIILIVYTVTFALAWLVPGNPLESPDGRRPDQAVVDAMLAQYKLDDPVAFYFDYLGKATGVSYLLGDAPRPFDLGPSLSQSDWTVNEILAAGLPVSVSLGLAAILIALVLGLLAGVIGGLRPNTALDAGTQALAVIGISLPSFVIGVMLLILFAVKLGWFPIGGWGDLQHVVLPAFALSLPFAAYIARLTRFGMIDEMKKDYIRTARAKGLPERQVAMGHALRNAFLPVLSYLGPATAIAMTGSFVIEKVFAVPGIGRNFVDAVMAKDITLIMGVVLVYSILLVLFNLIVDVLYSWIDPRISL